MLPLCPPGYTPSVPVTLPSSPLSGTASGCASFLLSLSSLVLILSQHHIAMKAMVPHFILSPTLCVKGLTTVCRPLPVIQSPPLYAALCQTLEIQLFIYFSISFTCSFQGIIAFILQSIYRSLSHPLCSYRCSLMLLPQLFYFSLSLSVSASPDRLANVFTGMETE